MLQGGVWRWSTISSQRLILCIVTLCLVCKHWQLPMSFCDDDENPQDQKSPLTYGTCVSYLDEMERWLDMGERPTKLYFEDDRDILKLEEDEMYSEAVSKLSKRCQAIRCLLWSLMPAPPRDEHLTIKDSWLGGQSGLGLFAAKDLCKDTVVCYYTGQEHSMKTSRRLDDRSYLNQVSENLFVDPKPCPNIKARYINDCINPNAYNCYYESNLSKRCVEVRALRNIRKGEELFVSYGSKYWDQAQFSPIVLSDEKIGKFMQMVSHNS